MNATMGLPTLCYHPTHCHNPANLDAAMGQAPHLQILGRKITLTDKTNSGNKRKTAEKQTRKITVPWLHFVMKPKINNNQHTHKTSLPCLTESRFNLVEITTPYRIPCMPCYLTNINWCMVPHSSKSNPWHSKHSTANYITFHLQYNFAKKNEVFEYYKTMWEVETSLWPPVRRAW
jgi:hypothetical protein